MPQLMLTKITVMNISTKPSIKKTAPAISPRLLLLLTTISPKGTWLFKSRFSFERPHDNKGDIYRSHKIARIHMY